MFVLEENAEKNVYVKRQILRNNNITNKILTVFFWQRNWEAEEDNRTGSRQSGAKR